METKVFGAGLGPLPESQEMGSGRAWGLWGVVPVQLLLPSTSVPW